MRRWRLVTPEDVSEHTPTPWVVNGFGGSFRVIARTAPNAIAISASTPPGDEMANARYIVLAVNAHADLVEALKRCLPAIRMYANLDDCEAAEAALAKAEALQGDAE